MPSAESLRTHLALSAHARMLRAEGLMRLHGATVAVAKAYAGAYKAAAMAGLSDLASLAAERAHTVRELL